ncbi:MAG TPA: hypothetical protein VJ461_04465 [Candidatus Nanoarchaeia archaeon]|nr:hypothetical protein [Candidatus Nanoarchaeia archaeon]
MHVKKWVKWAAGAVMVGAIGYGVNHYTGDKIGLERLITGKEQVAETKTIEPKLMRFGSEQYEVIKIPDTPYLYSVTDHRKLYAAIQKLTPEERKSAATLYILKYDELVIPVLIKKGVTDNSYTAVEKVLAGELKEGDSIIIGYASGSPPATARPGQNPLQSMQRILR